MSAVGPVTFSLEADGVGWIVFDDPAARANVFNAATQTAFAAALDAAATARALVIRSAKERIFLAGADLQWLATLPDAAGAAEFSRAGQKLFQRLADFPAPVVCAIHGACAGGGFELALACHWRMASDAPVTQIGLPETGIGTIPGWGGSVRLPRLIGAKPALDHILAARLVGAAEARRAGLVDEIVPAPELRARARQAALRLAAEGRPVRSAPAGCEPAVFAGLRAATVAKTPGRQPAPVAAIDLVERTAGAPFPEALELEARAFGDVTAGAVCKNLVHVFFLRDAAKKRTLDGWFPAGAAQPRPIQRVGVVGAGVMGSGVAQWLAAHAFEVVMRDVQPALVERGLGVIRGLFDDAVKRGKLSTAEGSAGLRRVATTAGWDGFDTCDLVIEAIVENAAEKQKMFSELAALVRRDALLASNTSALPIEEIAGHVADPSRTLGLHFFNPVSRMPLVELIIGPHTSAVAAASALALVKALGKSPAICRSAPGFVVTRVLFFYLNEAVRLWEQGVPAEHIDPAMQEWGWPMGPLRLIDEVGVDVTGFIFGEMEHYFPSRFSGTAACGQMAAAGWRGRKADAGAGFYHYEAGRASVNGAAAALVRGGGPPMEERAIQETLMGVMVREAEAVLAEGVVRSADDLDFALLLGAGFPAWRGGLLRWARAERGAGVP
ncbi:MAG: enoyl-CoA hydratase/isomerase family protein [Verrucomicrobia bacterium]|nr:enoyl-CoA hydratase/isomerase family protein [Verrucomicrobiota bacterium]